MTDVVFLPTALDPILSILYNSLSFLIILFSLVSSNSSLLLLAPLFKYVNKAKWSKSFPSRTCYIQYMLLPVHLGRYTFWELSIYLPLLLSLPQFSFCPAVLLHCIALTKASGGLVWLNPVDTYQSSSYLIILVDHTFLLEMLLFCFSAIFCFSSNHSGHSSFVTHSLEVLV